MIANSQFNYITPIESLDEYVLVNTKRQRLDCFRKESGRWFLVTYSDEQDFQLSSINFEDKLVDLSEDVSFVEHL